MAVTLADILDHMLAVASWVDPGATCDRVIRGAPDRETRRVGVGWVPCATNLEAAAADGCDLFVTHEDVWYGQWAPGRDSSQTPWGRRRMGILDAADMACVRLHDTWDNFPEHGIRDAWREFLGLGEVIAERPYYNAQSDVFAQGNSLALCRVAPTSFGEFAESLARRCAEFPCFQGATVCGEADARVESAAVGVGCHIPVLEMVELGAGALVLTLDRALQTVIRIPLSEMGAKWIAVEHGVAEMPGMKKMAAYLEQTFPGVEAKFYCEEPEARTVLG